MTLIRLLFIALLALANSSVFAEDSHDIDVNQLDVVETKSSSQAENPVEADSPKEVATEKKSEEQVEELLETGVTIPSIVKQGKKRIIFQWNYVKDSTSGGGKLQMQRCEWDERKSRASNCVEAKNAKGLKYTSIE